MQEFVARVVIVDMSCSSKILQRSGNDTGSMLGRMLQIDLNQPTEAVFSEINSRASSKDVAGLMKSNIRILGETSHEWIPNLKVLVQEYTHISEFELEENDWRKPI